jgi:hypothetical protein
MNDRVPGNDAAESSAGKLHGCNGPLVEAQVRIRPTRGRDHCRRQVDSENAQPERVEVRGHPTGATTKVGDRAAAGAQDELSEGREQRQPESTTSIR